jgi:hypothetical protein
MEFPKMRISWKPRLFKRQLSLTQQKLSQDHIPPVDASMICRYVEDMILHFFLNATKRKMDSKLYKTCQCWCHQKRNTYDAAAFVSSLLTEIYHASTQASSIIRDIKNVSMILHYLFLFDRLKDEKHNNDYDKRFFNRFSHIKLIKKIIPHLLQKIYDSNLNNDLHAHTISHENYFWLKDTSHLIRYLIKKYNISLSIEQALSLIEIENPRQQHFYICFDLDETLLFRGPTAHKDEVLNEAAIQTCSLDHISLRVKKNNTLMLKTHAQRYQYPYKIIREDKQWIYIEMTCEFINAERIRKSIITLNKLKEKYKNNHLDIKYFIITDSEPPYETDDLINHIERTFGLTIDTYIDRRDFKKANPKLSTFDKTHYLKNQYPNDHIILIDNSTEQIKMAKNSRDTMFIKMRTNPEDAFQYFNQSYADIDTFIQSIDSQNQSLTSISL